MRRSICCVLGFLALASTFGCSTAADRALNNSPGTPVQRVFFADFDEVGRAIHAAMNRYPQRVDNLDAGQFETDYIKGDQRFSAPGTKQDLSSGVRYRLLIRVLKGKAESKAATKVLITKAIEIQHDFFSEPEPLPSDGLEEMVILYRIQREITVERAVHKAQEKSQG